MKTINQSNPLNFELFVKGMEKGYSGGGNDEIFTFSQFNGIKCDFSVSQELMLAYNNYVCAKQILINQLNKEE